jgi:hypothetical protein
MALSYLDALPNKKFVPNIIIRVKSVYLSIRQPDSGLVVLPQYNGLVTQVNVNPTAIDPFRASTSVNNYSVTLLDKSNVISLLFNDDPKFFQGELVEIWIGRVNATGNPDNNMPFSEYYKLPDVFVNKVSKQENRYTFNAIEARDRLSTGAYQQATKLANSILFNTTVITLQSTSGFPLTGTVQIENEFISYAGISGNNLTGCIRGEESSTPEGHPESEDVFLVQILEANPIDLILQLLISSGGGGPYDVLPDGGAIDESLIDIAQFEQIRAEFFSTYTFKLIIGNLTSLKKLIEDELLFPLGLRLRGNNNSKIGLALIDRNIFDIDVPILDHGNITKNPDFSVDDTKVVNRLRISWDWSDTLKQYLKTSEFENAESIAEFGQTAFTDLRFKGIRDSLAGASIVNDIQLLFLSRFSFPRPQISVSSQMSASYLNLGDKSELITTLLPNSAGELNFVSTLEVISKAVNFTSGDVRFGLSFTSFSGVRSCYIAPSDVILTFSDQRTVTVGAGRGDCYRRGWKMRLFSLNTDDYTLDAINEIESVVGDVITFKNDWSTILTNNEYRIKFADYDDVTEQQKRFCFISAGSDDFSDNRPPYQITFG